MSLVITLRHSRLSHVTDIKCGIRYTVCADPSLHSLLSLSQHPSPRRLFRRLDLDLDPDRRNKNRTEQKPAFRRCKRAISLLQERNQDILKHPSQYSLLPPSLRHNTTQHNNPDPDPPHSDYTTQFSHHLRRRRRRVGGKKKEGTLRVATRETRDTCVSV